jgi:hypothetical protein
MGQGGTTAVRHFVFDSCNNQIKCGCISLLYLETLVTMLAVALDPFVDEILCLHNK